MPASISNAYGKAGVLNGARCINQLRADHANLRSLCLRNENGQPVPRQRRRVVIQKHQHLPFRRFNRQIIHSRKVERSLVANTFKTVNRGQAGQVSSRGTHVMNDNDLTTLIFRTGVYCSQALLEPFGLARTNNNRH